MKLNKPERAAMKDRVNWLKGLLKERNYDIGRYRNDFLYVYYSIARMIYSSRLSRDLLHHINGQFKKPLPESSIDSIITNIEQNIEQKTSPSRYRNQDIISKLGITDAEKVIICFWETLTSCNPSKRANLDILRKPKKR